MAEKNTKGEIVIYKDKNGPELEVSFENGTLWLNQAQIAELFQTDRSSITKHLNNIVNSGELVEKSNVQNLHIANADRPVKFYSLDFVISVGYRVNSKRATQFRIWATQKLKDYLLKGYVINEKRLHQAQETRLKELQQAHVVIQQALEAKTLLGYEKELVGIINDYTQTWINLSRYDQGDLAVAKKTSKKIDDLDYIKAKQVVEHFKERLLKSEIATGGFGRENGSELDNLLKYLKRTKMSVADKAATMFYTIIKNRPFMDGNKRIASLLFVVFLIQNRLLYDKRGERKFNDNALIALALLIDQTKPSEKDSIIELVSKLVVK